MDSGQVTQPWCPARAESWRHRLLCFGLLWPAAGLLRGSVVSAELHRAPQRGLQRPWAAHQRAAAQGACLLGRHLSRAGSPWGGTLTSQPVTPGASVSAAAGRHSRRQHLRGSSGQSADTPGGAAAGRRASTPPTCTVARSSQQSSGVRGGCAAGRGRPPVLPRFSAQTQAKILLFCCSCRQTYCR
jgi:hypothetical protein